MIPEIYSFIITFIIIVIVNFERLVELSSGDRREAWIVEPLHSPSDAISREEYELAINKFLFLSIKSAASLQTPDNSVVRGPDLQAPDNSVVRGPDLQAPDNSVVRGPDLQAPDNSVVRGPDLQAPDNSMVRGPDLQAPDTHLLQDIEQQFLSVRGDQGGTNRWMRILKMPSRGFHSFNTSASDKVGNFRHRIHDTRPAACKNRKYAVEKLPETSVIIIFHNEARSTLLRTVHSVIERTPARLLKEIVLVDDASTFDWLREPLGDYVMRLRSVRLVRLEEREGLIRARVRGATEARGEVLVFLDAHTEVNKQWLEPMLQRITENPKVLAIPEMDPINHQSLDYQRTSDWFHGSFRWNLQFKYKKFPVEWRGERTAPIPSPVMVGCAHAIRKDYFFETGGYDTDMDIWGGENIEHAFRLWMCGGRVEVIPCSKVGHLFKPKLPYDFTGDAHAIIQRNLIRTAEVWMDEHKHLFYATQTSLSAVDMDSLNQRRLLRQRLRCKSFQWYLDNVAPDIPVPPRNVTYYGDIEALTELGYCVEADTEKLWFSPVSCDDQEWQRKGFYIDTNGCFHQGKFIITILTDSSFALSDTCVSTEAEWAYTDNKQIKNIKLDACLQLNKDPDSISLVKCSSISAQKWKFRYHFDFTKKWDLGKMYRNLTQAPQGVEYFGKLQNLGSHKCLNMFDDTEYRLVSCHKLHKYEQIIKLDQRGTLSFNNLCVQESPNNDIMLVDCSSKNTGLWEHDKGKRTIKLKTKDKCMMYHPSKSNKVLLAKCRVGDKYQKWTF